MKQMGEMLLRREPFEEIVMGNTALVRAMVASDTFVQLNLMNIIGGMVVVLGDDPGAEGSSLNRVVDHGNDSRGIITMGLPFLSLMDVLETVPKKPDILAWVCPPHSKDACARFPLKAQVGENSGGA
jgi:hypothetical protein